MAIEDDLVTPFLLASSAFFVVLGFGLLLRYRQVSQRINTSTDLGRDLWTTLEQRLNKQDERILDVMTKYQVIQSRYEKSTLGVTQIKGPIPRLEPRVGVEKAPYADTDTYGVMSRDAQIRDTSHITLDKTEIAVVNLLSVKSRSSVEIKDLISKSREHTARLMKKLFDLGLVTRDSSKKPFVYQLSEDGRRHVSLG